MEIKTFTSDKLNIRIFSTRAEMGSTAAADAAAYLKAELEKKEELNCIFAAAPSQNEFLDALANSDVDFTRINAYHMDEYIGLPADAPQGFGNFLRRAIFGKAPFKSVSYIDPTAADPKAEAERYSKLLEGKVIDAVFLGIGENGHVAFNDPAFADLKDKLTAKPVELDDICRNQQVHDGCFASLDEVPKTAITLTVPALMRGRKLFCVVPAPAKAWAAKETVTGTIDEHCPASAMRLHDDATLYLDADSGAGLTEV